MEYLKEGIPVYAFEGGPMITFRITDEEMKRIEEIKNHARENIIKFEVLRDIVMGRRKPITDDDAFSVWLGGDEFPIRVVYTIEEQPKKKLYVHMSFSGRAPITGKPCLPSVRLTGEIMSVFGMRGSHVLLCVKEDGHYKDLVILRETGPGRIPVINVMEEFRHEDDIKAPV